jgi:hypothetical protein
VSTFGPAGEAGRQALLGLLNHPAIGPILRGLRPTPTQVGTVLLDLNTRQPVTTAPTDYSPLGANFSTMGAGYKAVRSGCAWTSGSRSARRPDDAGVNPASCSIRSSSAVLGAGIAQGLINLGQSPQAAQATAARGRALTPLIAALPVGAVAFDHALYDQPLLVYSYQNPLGYVNVNGVDLAADFLLNDRWSLEGTYSFLSDNLFPNAPGATPLNPLAANTARHRGSAALRYSNPARGITPVPGAMPMPSVSTPASSIPGNPWDDGMRRSWSRLRGRGLLVAVHSRPTSLVAERHQHPRQQGCVVRWHPSHRPVGYDRIQYSF